MAAAMTSILGHAFIFSSCWMLLVTTTASDGALLRNALTWENALAENGVDLSGTSIYKLFGRWCRRCWPQEWPHGLWRHLPGPCNPLRWPSAFLCECGQICIQAVGNECHTLCSACVQRNNHVFFHCGIFSWIHLRTAGPVQRSVRRSPPVWPVLLDSCRFCPAGQLQPISHLLGQIVVRAPAKKHDGMSNVACSREVKDKSLFKITNNCLTGGKETLWKKWESLRLMLQAGQ